MVKRHHTKSCCGKKQYIFETSRPVNRSHIPAFRKAGYISQEHFEKIGIFHIEAKGVQGECPIGSNRVVVKASAGGLSKPLLDALANALERIVEHNLKS
jgi:hypothetical protein